MQVIFDKITERGLAQQMTRVASREEVLTYFEAGYRRPRSWLEVLLERHDWGIEEAEAELLRRAGAAASEDDSLSPRIRGTLARTRSLDEEEGSSSAVGWAPKASRTGRSASGPSCAGLGLNGTLPTRVQRFVLGTQPVTVGWLITPSRLKGYL